jgi:predicted ATPase
MPFCGATGYAKPVPTSDALTVVLLERIRSLNRTDRAVLMRASIIGRRFRVAVLHATVELAEERVRAALDKACTLELIQPERADGEWYTFCHALIRDAMYEQFVKSRVRHAHRRIALAVERHAGQDALDDLAYHSWAGGDATRCIRYNELAGDRAVAVFAYDDARTLYGRARAFAPLRSLDYMRLSGKIAALQGDSEHVPGVGT